jgi:hypothetical protein
MKTLKFCSAVLACTLMLAPAWNGYAQDTPATASSTVAYNNTSVPLVGADPQSPVVKSLVEAFADLVQASNKHSIEDILKHYSPKFISGDNLTLPQIKDLIMETWKSYPDIRYNSRPIEVRVNEDWATIETLDNSTATAPPDKDVLDVPGKLVSSSRSLLFFRRTGNTWEITSDSTIWEEANIRYGIGDDVSITLSAPEQVKAGEPYSATIQAKLPEGTFTIATIDNQPLTYPHPQADDKFRPLAGDNNSLQRVLHANTTNHNEIVTATIGLTGVEQKNPERPSLSVNGIATIVKRVNVVPISAEDVLSSLQKKELVKTAASGQSSFQETKTEAGTNATPDSQPEQLGE